MLLIGNRPRKEARRAEARHFDYLRAESGPSISSSKRPNVASARYRETDIGGSAETIGGCRAVTASCQSLEAGMKGNQVRLFVGTPCYGGMVTSRYMQSICALLCHKIPNLHVSIKTVAYKSLVTRGRNTILAAFLDLPAETHLMFIDADIGFNVDQVQRMLNFNQDVVAGMYPLKRIDYDQAAFQRAAGGEPLQTAQLRYVGLPRAKAKSARPRTDLSRVFTPALASC